MSKKEIKPCPFCGGIAIHKSTKNVWGKCYFVYCQGCGCNGPIADTIDKAVMYWGSRR
jgi:Lar family restriction alleviation protein